MKFQDCHSLRGWVVRSPPGIDLCHADVFDANLLTKLSHFLGQTVVLGLQPDPLVAAVGGPVPPVGQGILCEGDYMENGGFDVGAPVLGEWDLWGVSLAGHLDLEGIVLSSAPLKISITSMNSEDYDTWQDNPEIAGLPQAGGSVPKTAVLRANQRHTKGILVVVFTAGSSVGLLRDARFHRAVAMREAERQGVRGGIPLVRNGGGCGIDDDLGLRVAGHFEFGVALGVFGVGLEP